MAELFRSEHCLRLREFVAESNRIEGICREPTRIEIQAHETFLSRDRIDVMEIEMFVGLVAGAKLRRELGMNVRVGNHYPPKGGPEVERCLDALLSEPGLTPYELHVRYEKLHPFMDGNGRSGRVLWAWFMQRLGQDPFALPFLHRFYYQALDASRA